MGLPSRTPWESLSRNGCLAWGCLLLLQTSLNLLEPWQDDSGGGKQSVGQLRTLWLGSGGCEEAMAKPPLSWGCCLLTTAVFRLEKTWDKPKSTWAMGM